MKSMALSLGAAVLFFAVTCWGAGWNFIASGILSILLYGGLLLLTKLAGKAPGRRFYWILVAVIAVLSAAAFVCLFPYWF